MTTEKQVVKIGRNADTRLALYDRYASDMSIAEDAWQHTVSLLRRPEYMECTTEEVLALYEKRKTELLAVRAGMKPDGLTAVFDKSHNI